MGDSPPPPPDFFLFVFCCCMFNELMAVHIWVRSLNDVQLPIFGLSSLQTLAELSNVHLFLYFSVPMYRKQLGLSENIYLCSLSLDFLAVIAFQSFKNHENSAFSVKFTYISFSSFLKSHFTAHCEFCALPHTSQFKYQILLECLDAKSARTRQG